MMSEVRVSDEPEKPTGIIKNPQDFYGGFALVLLAALALWASRELPGQQGFAFGPGTAPRLFITLLGIAGLAIMVHGFIVPGRGLERYHIRGPVFILGSVIAFALAIRPLGLVLTCLLTIFISAAGTKEVVWKETAIVAVLLTLFCSLLFPYGLNLPIPLWPRF